MLLLKTKLLFSTFTFADKTAVKLEEKSCDYGVITHIISTKKVDLKADPGQKTRKGKINEDKAIYLHYPFSHIFTNQSNNHLNESSALEKLTPSVR